ncbi:MAG: LptF/LptG family permease, partial [Litorivicinaceae bacterium]
LIVLIGVAAGLGGLAQHSALTVLRASGLSILQILAKVLVGLSPLCVGVLLIAQLGIPQAEQWAESLKVAYTRGDSSAALWTRDLDRYVWLRGDAEGSVATWRHLTIDPETRQLATLIESGSVRLEAGSVQLADATRLTLTPEQITQERTAMTFDTGLQASGVRWLILPAEQLSLTELWVAQQFLTAQGLQSRTHAQVFWQRLAAPLTLAVLGLLAAVTAFGTFRGLSLSSRVFLAVLAGLVFKYLMDMTAPLTLLLGWHPSIAVLLPLALPLVLIPRALRP